MIVLLCLTPVFRNMPQNAQGAVIIAAVVGLFNYEEWWFLFKARSLPLPTVLHLANIRHYLLLCRKGIFDDFQQFKCEPICK